MPVASPTRFNSTSSSITGSYRSTLSSSTSLDKPYYRSSGGTYVSSTLRNNYGDRTTEYRSRYSDIDGKRERKTSLVEYGRNSRAPSVTDSESGISRYRNDRSESRTRDLSTTRSDSGKTTSEPLPRTKRPFVASAALAMSTAELYDKYSPNNYIPLTQRLQQQQNNYGEISRSKSISNDIGRPPSDPSKLRKPRTSAATIIERPERRYKELSPTLSYSKRNSMTNGVKDSNGNEVSVSEMRKRFDPKMTVTKLPTNDTRYAKTSVEQYLSQLKDTENGLNYTKKPKDDLVPVHLPYVDKNGTTKYDSSTKYDTKNGTSKYDTANKYDFKVGKYEGTPNGSRNSSSSDLTKEKSLDRNISVTLTAKLPSAAKNLDPNNPIGKILEKSTVIQSENGDFRKSPKKDELKTPKHTSNFASYIQISQPIASGSTISPKRDVNDVSNDKEPRKTLSDEKKTLTDEKEPRKKTKISIKYVDSDSESNVLDNLNDIESPSGTGFENKTFDHEIFLKKRIEKNGEIRSKNDEERYSNNGEDKLKNGEERDEEVKSMDTSTESTLSESTEDSSPETPSSRRKILENNFEEYRTELAGGKGGPSGLRRSSERSEIVNDRSDKASTHTSGLNGLRNIGNTCFMNSVIQCLSNTRPLLEYLQAERHAGEINTTLSCMKGALIGAFASVIKELWRSGEKDSVVNTTSLKSQVQRFAPRFMGYSQQDAQEFLRYLLEGLHEDVNRVTVKPKPILTEIDEKLSDTAKAAEAWSRYLRMEESRVGDIFVGQLKSTLRCTHCNHDSVTFDPFWDLSLPIPSRTGNMKLQQCLQHFTKEEELDGDEKPTCSACGVRRKCLKWFMVQKFPQVLVIHLKRFSPTERFRGKLNVLVEFPLSGLDMAPYAAAKGGPAIYNLYAVSNHSGTTYSGHYTAYCKHPYSGEWHEYNDSRVSTIKPRDVVSPEAYVLFYELARS